MIWSSVLAGLARPFLVAIGGLLAYWKGRHDAKRNSELHARRAMDEQRRKADDAAREYRASGLVERLRRNGF